MGLSLVVAAAGCEGTSPPTDGGRSDGGAVADGGTPVDAGPVGGDAGSDSGAASSCGGFPQTVFGRSPAGPTSCPIVVCVDASAEACAIHAPGFSSRCGDLPLALELTSPCGNGGDRNLFADSGWSIAGSTAGDLEGSQLSNVPEDAHVIVSLRDPDGAAWTFRFTWSGTELTVLELARD